MKGGHLFDRLVAKKMYTEKEARDACLGLLKGVEFMHEKSIVHRDLKPENLLLVVRIRLRKKTKTTEWNLSFSYRLLRRTMRATPT